MHLYITKDLFTKKFSKIKTCEIISYVKNYIRLIQTFLNYQTRIIYR